MKITLESPTVKISKSLYELLTVSDSLNMRVSPRAHYLCDEWVEEVMGERIIHCDGIPVGTLNSQGNYLGFWVAAPFRGKDLAYQASVLALRDMRGVVEAGCWVENTASSRVLHRLGFRQVNRYPVDGKQVIAWRRD